MRGVRLDADAYNALMRYSARYVPMSEGRNIASAAILQLISYCECEHLVRPDGEPIA
jgi:hypothetical protein